MNKYWKNSLTAMVLMVLTVQATAINYTFEGAEVGGTAKATSVPVSIPAANSTVDLSKDAALTPPFFGSAESYLPAENAGTSGSTNGNAANGGYVPAYPDSVKPDKPYTGTRFTSLSDDDYYSDGRIGRLKIPALDINEKIYEGATSSNMAKGIAHISDTSVWNGNVALAGHNRGSNDVFKNIHKLETGDRITLTTKNGSRTYSVYSVSKVKETDTSCLDAAYDNILTLVTCVRNESEYRYVVRAKEI